MDTELSLTIIAVSLVILVIFAVVAVVFMIQLFITLKKTTTSVEQRITPIIDGANRIIDLTENTGQQIRDNIEVTKPFFQSVGKISNLFEELPKRFKNEMHDNTMTINFEARKGKIDLGDWAEWLAHSIAMIQKLRHK